MRIVVYGTGGAGGHFGARLARAGEDVVFIARGAHLDAIRASGLHVEAETPEREIHLQPARATADPDAVSEAEVVLLGVKTWQVEDAGRAMAPALPAGAFVVPLQNGVEAADQLRSTIGSDRVIGGVCRTISFLVGPGRIRTVGAHNSVQLGELDNAPSARTARLRETLERAGLQASIPADIHAAVWTKFSFVVPVGSVGAFLRQPIGRIRSDPASRAMLERGMREIVAVARARGIALADETVTSSMAFVDTLDPSGTSSLQRDLAEEKPSELEAWTGAVVRLGRESGVPTPLHAEIYAALLPLEETARERISKR
jgi:2-dehydropantoate 2-reductase